jgi:hypothetical protein
MSKPVIGDPKLAKPIADCVVAPHWCAVLMVLQRVAVLIKPASALGSDSNNIML